VTRLTAAEPGAVRDGSCGLVLYLGHGRWHSVLARREENGDGHGERQGEHQGEHEPEAVRTSRNKAYQGRHAR
jgi:hypothetical protein